jgi:hypothetical protein
MVRGKVRQSVTTEQVNAFLWRKQHLAPGTAGNDVPSVVRDVVALHATSALTPYLSLRARVVDFQPTQLDAELYIERRLLKVLCMRQTVHVVPLSELATVTAATGERLRRNAERELGQLLGWSGASGPAEQEATLVQLQAAIAEVIAARGPSTAAELSEAIPELKQRFQYAPGKPYSGDVSLGSMLLPRLTPLGLLVRGRPRGSWRSNQHEYALLHDWLPQGDLPSIPPDQGQVQLLRHYLAAYGPASLNDAAWWAGWSKREAQRALSALGRQVVQLDIHKLGAGFWLLADDLPTLLSTPPLTSGAVQLLPSLDGYVMGFCDRRRFLDPEHYDQVFDPSGNAFATVWVDGRVVGIWRETEHGLEVLVWDELAREEVAADAARLGSFLRQADGGQTKYVGEVVRRYPAELYVKTPFNLGRR